MKRILVLLTLAAISEASTQLVGEPITTNLVLGLVAVFAGIWIATSQVKKP